jgi:type I restriction enzyme S subunit
MVELADVLTLIRNGSTSEQIADKQGIPITRIETISDGTINSERVGWTKPKAHELEGYKLQVGDILFSHINSIEHLGKCAIYEGEPPILMHGMNLLLLRANKLLIEPEFLLKYLRSQPAINSIRARAGRAVNQASINQKALQSIPFILPPLPEQRRIVSILREGDKLGQMRRLADEKAVGLLPSIFNQLFGQPPEWRETEPLEKFVQFVGGGTPDRKIERYFSGDIPWATSKDVKARYLHDAQEHITQEAIDNSATTPVPANTILIVVKSKILAHTLPVAIATRQFCFGQDLKGLVCNEGVEPEFIVGALLAQTKHILNSARGVNTEGLTLEILRRIQIPKVEPIQQKRFVERVEEFNILEESRKKIKDGLESLFHSLLTQAFIGELTARWREQHAAELTEAAAERDHLLLSAGRAPTRLVVEAPPAAIPASLIERSEFTRTLSPKQQHILQQLSQLDQYFTVDLLHEQLLSNDGRDADAAPSLAEVRHALELFTDAGVAMKVSVGTSQIGNIGDAQAFTQRYRFIRLAQDEAKFDDLSSLGTSGADTVA